MPQQNQNVRPLGSTGLYCHPMGFGTYRVQDGIAKHEAALRAYLDRGGNLIDTSANYGDGLSEILIERVLKDFDRSKIILVTKGGYIQGQNMELAQQRQFPEIVRYTDGLWHCIHPEFLETQIDRSLQRLDQKYVDGYLLHNPEYYINHAAQIEPISDKVLDEFYRRIRAAFEYLESQVQSGRIRFYGISSNNFGYHERDRAGTSVVRSLEAAESVSRDHHFRIIQLPLNLYEAGGAVYPSHKGQTVFEFCKSNGIGVLINRPLNAFYQNKLVRLADFVTPGSPAPGDQALNELLLPLEEAEHEFSSKFGAEAFGEKHEGLAEYFKYIINDLPSRDYWEAMMDQYIIPPVTHWLKENHQKFLREPDWAPWQNEFIRRINQAMDEIEKFLSFKDQPKSDAIRQKLYEAGYPQSPESLSRMALSVVAQLDGVSCVLNGMRTPAYVDDAMYATDMPRVSALEILKEFFRNLNGVVA